MIDGLDSVTLLDLWDMFILYAAGFAMGRTTASTSPTSTNGDT